MPGEQRIKNGITGTVIDASRREDKVTIKTNEHEPREVEVDTGKFSDLSLSYAVHVNKGQGITAETSGILIGGWQTDKEHAYVTVSRAREQTQIYVSREDLGEQGFDTGAMERLAEKMKRSRAQQATITKKISERGPERQQATERPQQRGHAINVDRSGDVGEQAREVEAIEHLAEHLRNEGAGEATITQEIAKQTAGREADLERNTQAQAKHERYIDQVLQQQRQRLLDEEHRVNQTKDADRDPVQPEPSDPSPTTSPSKSSATPTSSRPSRRSETASRRSTRASSPTTTAIWDWGSNSGRVG